jgi:hypothetical protein
VAICTVEVEEYVFAKFREVTRLRP